MQRFHTYKHVALLGRARKGANPKADALKLDPGKRGKVNEETNSFTAMLSQMWREMNVRQDDMSNKIVIEKELDANFTFPKIHLMSQ